MIRRRWAGYLFLFPYLILFCTFLLGPLIVGLVMSFMEYDMLSPTPARFVGVTNYREALYDPYFWKSLRATTLFVVLSVPITIPLALLLAVALESVGGRRQMLYRIAIFAPTVISVSVVSLIWRWFYNKEFGLLNAILAWAGIEPVGWLHTPFIAMASIVAMTLWWTIGGPMLVMLAGLKQIPQQYYEAAAIDGSIGWSALIKITLPLLKPALLFSLVMNIIGAFQVFGQPFILTGGGPELSTRVTMQYIYQSAFQFYRLGYGSAMSWLLFIVIAFFAAIQFRLMRER